MGYRRPWKSSDARGGRRQDPPPHLFHAPGRPGTERRTGLPALPLEPTRLRLSVRLRPKLPGRCVDARSRPVVAQPARDQSQGRDRHPSRGGELPRAAGEPHLRARSLRRNELEGLRVGRRSHAQLRSLVGSRGNGRLRPAGRTCSPFGAAWRRHDARRMLLPWLVTILFGLLVNDLDNVAWFADTVSFCPFAFVYCVSMTRRGPAAAARPAPRAAGRLLLEPST